MKFRYEYYFLSNMYPCKIKLGKYTFSCAEAAFQAAKCPARVSEFIGIDGYAAKKLGRKVELRSDWNEVKLNFMERIVRAKFNQHPELKEKLINLDCPTIVEDNNWGDTFWGVCNGKGENHLGKILTKLKEEGKQNEITT